MNKKINEIGLIKKNTSFLKAIVILIYKTLGIKTFFYTYYYYFRVTVWRLMNSTVFEKKIIHCCKIINHQKNHGKNLKLLKK